MMQADREVLFRQRLPYVTLLLGHQAEDLGIADTSDEARPKAKNLAEIRVVQPAQHQVAAPGNQERRSHEQAPDIDIEHRPSIGKVLSDAAQGIHDPVARSGEPSTPANKRNKRNNRIICWGKGPS